APMASSGQEGSATFLTDQVAIGQCSLRAIAAATGTPPRGSASSSVASRGFSQDWKRVASSAPASSRVRHKGG
ncbi:MAG: hypothetical protein ACK5R2_14985, partial [Cyanobacteriota bacterium]